MRWLGVYGRLCHDAIGACAVAGVFGGVPGRVAGLGVLRNAGQCFGCTLARVLIEFAGCLRIAVLFGCFFQHRVGSQRRLNLLLQVESGKLQQADGLLQLRRHLQLLAQPQGQGLFHVRAVRRTLRARKLSPR